MAGGLTAGAAIAAILQACKVEKLSPSATAEPSPTRAPDHSPTVPTAAAPTPTPAAPPWTPTSTVPPPATTTAAPAATTPRATPTPSPPPGVAPDRAERAKLAHLLRRAGFGASQAELDRYQQIGLAATVEILLDYDKVDDSAWRTRSERLGLDLTKPADLQKWWLLRMVHSQRPLQEKMTLFWHGLLTSGLSRVGRAELMWRQNELLREKALGSFPVILKAIAQDPAMLIWLDSRSNQKASPNENFARELMELFSMGVGNYSEQDVRESARAFTGWFLGNQGFFFNAGQHDYGTKTFLGVSGNFDGNDIIDIIVKQPACGTYICRKLFAFFAYDDPEPEVLERLRNAFTRSGYSIKAVMREILAGPELYSAKAYRARPKSPVELVAGTIRTLGIDLDTTGLPTVLLRMGQTLFDPPDVSGWPGGVSWLNTSTVLERVNFANRIATERRQFNIYTMFAKAGTASAGQALEHWVGLLLEGYMSEDARQVLEDYVRSLPAGASLEASVRSVLYLVLSSPEYQLA